LARLEQIFQETPKQGKSSTAQSNAGGQGREASRASATAEPLSPVLLPTIADAPPVVQISRAAVTNATMAQPGSANTTAGDPWAIGIGQVVTRLGSRGAWWFLLLLLAGLVGIEVQRRRRARKKAGE
jgi:hypothetical protein